jgi:hypothetical protein
LTFYATDGIAEAEMFCFDSIAKQLVGKPCEFLVKTMDGSGNTPSDLSAIIGLKFTFVVTIILGISIAGKSARTFSTFLQITVKCRYKHLGAT